MKRRDRDDGGTRRVGLFGQLGAGNVGNDGSLEAVLAYLRDAHPTAVLDAFCTGHTQVTARYGIPATPLHAYPSYRHDGRGTNSAALKIVGKVLDAFRTLTWVRRHDVVIVPGAGVLEATLPLRPWGFPYALLLLCAGGRLLGTRIALLNVGADVIAARPTRRIVTWAARLAHYRSFRDAHSKEAMRRMGVDTSGDAVYTDLAFALPTPTPTPGPAGAEAAVVGVGVMDWHGGDSDRARAAEIHAAYVATVQRFVRWLIDGGRHVRLFMGDEVDAPVAQAVIDDARRHRPDLDPSVVVLEATPTLDDLLRAMDGVDAVVATRYHNLVCALKLAKPTVSISYSRKSDALMADMGLAGFCHSAHAPDPGRLIEQFRELESRGPELRHVVADRTTAAAERLGAQFAVLSAELFPAVRPTAAASLRR